MLSSQWYAEQGLPVVFLHGLLGSKQDWQAVFRHLQNFSKIRPLAIDLPLHGLSENVSCDSFDDCRALLHHTLKSQLGSTSFYLVGYSLGGRIALDYTLKADNPNLLGTVLEGTHIGLADESERRIRLQNDIKWAQRFRLEPIETVLNDWYQQPVFADLTAAERQNLITARKNNHGQAIARMLEATSLAKQDDYSTLLKQTDKNLIFFIGENDLKFRQMALKQQLPTEMITNAGHNSHRQHPADFAEKLVKFIVKT